MTPPRQPGKIAVLRANGIGDFVFALPALQALRCKWPDAEIVYLAKELHQALLRGRPGPLDRVEVVPPCAGVGEAEDHPTDAQRVEDFLRRMRRERFDLALQMHGGGRFSNPFLLRLGAGFTVGLQTPDAPPLDISVPYRTYFSETLRYLELAWLVGAPPHDPYPRLALTTRDLDEARRAWPAFERTRYAYVHPGATDVRRHWPAERFAAVADRLCERGVTVCIGGHGAEEAGIAAQVRAAMRHGDASVDLCDRLSLNALVGILSRAALMLSNDSGPLHLAEALEVPSVGIYLACNMINAMPMRLCFSRPLISWVAACPRCGAALDALEESAALCPHDVSFATGVSVDEACDAVDSLLTHSVHTIHGVRAEGGA